MIGALTAGAAAGAAVWALYGYSCIRLRDVRNLETHSNAFYEGAKPFLDDPDTPEALLDFVGFLNRKISSRTASRELFSIIARGKFVGPLDKADRKRLEPVHEFLSKRPELKEPFASLIVNGLLAVSFGGNRLLGTFLRIWLSGALSSTDPGGFDPKSENVVIRYRSRSDHDDHRTPATATA